IGRRILIEQKPDLARSLFTDNPSEVGRTEAPVEGPDPRPGLSEPGVPGGYRKVAQHMKHVAASDCEAIHSRDHRLRHVPNQPVEVGDLEQTVRSRPVVAGLTPLLDVATDAECAVALAGEDDGANIDVRPCSL